MIILVWFSFPTSRGPIQSFFLAMNAMNFEMGNGMWHVGCEHSKSSFPTSDFPSLTSNFIFVTFYFSFCKCLTSITLIPPLNSTPLILVFFNENHNMTPLNNSTSHLSTYHMKWDIGNEKWETRCGKWEVRSGKWEVGSEGAEKQERCWIGPWEVGNETQTRILVTEVLPSR